MKAFVFFIFGISFGSVIQLHAKQTDCDKLGYMKIGKSTYSCMEIK